MDTVGLGVCAVTGGRGFQQEGGNLMRIAQICVRLVPGIAKVSKAVNPEPQILNPFHDSGLAIIN